MISRATSQPRDGAPPSARRHQLALSALVLAGVVVGAVLLVRRSAGLHPVFDALRSAEPSLVVACALAELTAYVGYLVVLRSVVGLEGGPVLPNGLAIRINLATLGASRIIAVGGAGGLAVLYWVLRQVGLSPRRAAARTLAMHISVYGVFALVGWSAAVLALAVRAFGGEASTAMALGWIVGVPALVASAWGVLRRRHRHRIVWGDGRVARAVTGVLDALDAVGRIARRPDRHRALLAGCAVFWAGDIACLWLAVRAVGGDLSPVATTLAFTTGYVAMLAPLPTGGFGAVDAAVTLTLVHVGLPVSTALAAVLTWRAFNFWLPTVPALVALSGVRDMGRSLRELAPESAAGTTGGGDAAPSPAA